MGIFTHEKTVTDRIGLLVGWFTLLTLYIVAGAWYIARRHTPYINARGPVLSLTLLSFIWITQGIAQIGDLIAPPVFCHPFSELLYPISTWSLFGVFSGSLYRCLALICRFESQRLRLSRKLQEEGFGMPLDNNLFQRNLNFLSGWWPPVILFLYSAALPFTRFIVPVDQRILCETIVTDAVPVTIAEAILVLLTIGLALKVRTVTESFGIVAELRSQGICGLAHVFFLILGQALFSPNNAFFHIEIITMEFVLWYVTLVRPLRMSYRTESAQSQSQVVASTTVISSLTVPPELSTFERLLASTPGRLSFRQHLVNEFSVENLFFYDDVMALRAWYQQNKPPVSAGAVGLDAEPDPLIAAFTNETRTRALALYLRYICPAAPFEINLSAANKTNLHSLFRVKGARGRFLGRPNSRTMSSSAARYKQKFVAPNHKSSKRPAHPPPARAGSRSERKSPPTLPTNSPAVVVTSGGAATISPSWSGAALVQLAAKFAAADVKRDSKTGLPAVAAAGAAVTAAAPAPAAAAAPAVVKGVVEAPAVVVIPPTVPLIKPGTPLASIDDEQKNDAAFYVHLFDAAHAEVYHLLVTDSYVRYVHSPAFEKLVQQQILANELAETPKVALTGNADLTPALGTVSAALSRGVTIAAPAGTSGGATAASPTHRKTLTATRINSLVTALHASGSFAPAAGGSSLSSPPASLSPPRAAVPASVTIAITSPTAQPAAPRPVGPRSPSKTRPEMAVIVELPPNQVPEQPPPSPEVIIDGKPVKS